MTTLGDYSGRRADLFEPLAWLEHNVDGVLILLLAT